MGPWCRFVASNPGVASEPNPELKVTLDEQELGVQGGVPGCCHLVRGVTFWLL